MRIYSLCNYSNFHCVSISIRWQVKMMQLPTAGLLKIALFKGAVSLWSSASYKQIYGTATPYWQFYQNRLTSFMNDIFLAPEGSEMNITYLIRISPFAAIFCNTLGCKGVMAKIRIHYQLYILTPSTLKAVTTRYLYLYLVSLTSS